jgi:serine/threonine protein kinase
MQAIRSASKRDKSNDIKDHYTVGKVIGRGTFAAVHLCTRISDGVEFAVKVFDKSAMSAKEAVSLTSEIDILRKVEHPNVVRLHETYDTDSHYYLVMECMHGGELFDRIVQKLSCVGRAREACVCRRIFPAARGHACGSRNAGVRARTNHAMLPCTRRTYEYSSTRILVSVRLCTNT